MSVVPLLFLFTNQISSRRNKSKSNNLDSCVVTNERIKEELKEGKSLKTALEHGNSESWSSIFDANVTTLLVGVILYIFGESSVKGFATMLIITIFVTIFACVILYRVLQIMTVKTKVFNDNEKLFIGSVHEVRKFNYVKFAKKPIIVSLSIITIGLIFVLVRGFNFGVDFTGGTQINLSSSEPLNFNKIKEIVKDYDLRDYDTYLNSKTEGYLKLNDTLDEEDEIKVKSELKSLGIDTSANEISNLVTSNLTKNAIKALLYSMIVIILYVAIRFNFNYAISGILMLLHDLLITLSIFAIFNISVDFIIVASLLTIVGYSINNTIVVFDRIRDNRNKLYKNRKKLTDEELENLVNISSNETITRNVWTSITTLAAIVTLLCVGLNDILTFNIAILVGLIAGTISSLLIAPRVWMLLERRSMDRPEEEDDEPTEMKVKGVNF